MRYKGDSPLDYDVSPKEIWKFKMYVLFLQQIKKTNSYTHEKIYITLSNNYDFDDCFCAV